jgi:hypothetical protein
MMSFVVFVGHWSWDFSFQRSTSEIGNPTSHIPYPRPQSSNPASKNRKPRKMHPLEKLTPLGMLEIWGLRVSGSSLKDPLAQSTGGRAGIDDELALALYVEATEGFEQSHPVLTHVYARFLPIQTYRYRQPGETRLRAAMRHGQASQMLDGKSDHQLTQKLHDVFMDALIKKQKQHPFKVPPRPEEVTAESIVQQVEADLY